MTAAHNHTSQVQSDHQVDVEVAKDVVVNGASVARTPAVAPAAGERPPQVDLYRATFAVSPNTLLSSHKIRQGSSRRTGRGLGNECINNGFVSSVS
jgi:hypothetical protein